MLLFWHGLFGVCRDTFHIETWTVINTFQPANTWKLSKLFSDTVESEIMIRGTVFWLAQAWCLQMFGFSRQVQSHSQRFVLVFTLILQIISFLQFDSQSLTVLCLCSSHPSPRNNHYLGPCLQKWSLFLEPVVIIWSPWVPHSLLRGWSWNISQHRHLWWPACLVS